MFSQKVSPISFWILNADLCPLGFIFRSWEGTSGPLLASLHSFSDFFFFENPLMSWACSFLNPEVCVSGNTHFKKITSKLLTLTLTPSTGHTGHRLPQWFSSRGPKQTSYIETNTFDTPPFFEIEVIHCEIGVIP